MGYYNTFLEKRKKLWGHQTNYLSGGPNLTIPPYTLTQNENFTQYLKVYILMIN